MIRSVCVIFFFITFVCVRTLNAHCYEIFTQSTIRGGKSSPLFFLFSSETNNYALYITGLFDTMKSYLNSKY